MINTIHPATIKRTGEQLVKDLGSPEQALAFAKAHTADHHNLAGISLNRFTKQTHTLFLPPPITQFAAMPPPTELAVDPSLPRSGWNPVQNPLPTIPPQMTTTKMLGADLLRMVGNDPKTLAQFVANSSNLAGRNIENMMLDVQLPVPVQAENLDPQVPITPAPRQAAATERPNTRAATSASGAARPASSNRVLPDPAANDPADSAGIADSGTSSSGQGGFGKIAMIAGGLGLAIVAGLFALKKKDTADVPPDTSNNKPIEKYSQPRATA